MKKWAFLVAFASLGLVGCAGSGVPGDGGGGGGGGGVIDDGRSVANVNLPPTVAPQIDVYFLPGQGRAVGDLSAYIRRVYFDDTNGERAEDPLFGGINLLLNGFNAQNKSINAPLQYGENSRNFTTYQLEVEELRVISDDAGNYVSYRGNNNQPLLSGTTSRFTDALSLTAFAGRSTTLQIYLNDAMLGFDGTEPTWDRASFLSSNTNPTTGKITGFLSDYVAFDISKVANRPTMQSPDAVGQAASLVYFSGDQIALSQAPAANPTTPRIFEVLTPFGAIDGTIQFVAAPVNRTQYELKQADPRFIEPPRLITALKGFVRSFDEVVTKAGKFEFMLMPKVGDGVKQDLVILQRTVNGNTAHISNMWFGEADFSSAPNPTFKAWSIDQVDDANRTNEVTGNFPASLLYGPGKAKIDTGASNWWQSVREGDFVFTTPPPGLPALNQTGRFIVFRR